MSYEKSKGFSPKTVEAKPIINTKERWLEFASHLFSCSTGAKSKDEVIAYLEFLQELIDTAKLFVPIQNWNKWQRVHQDISLNIKQISDQQEPISVNYEYCTNMIAGLEYEVRFTQRITAAENNEILKAKEDFIAQINDILTSSPDDAFIISKGLELLKAAFWLLNNDVKDAWEHIIVNISGKIRYINMMAKNDPDFNYGEEIKNLGEIMRQVLLQLIQALK